MREVGLDFVELATEGEEVSSMGGGERGLNGEAKVGDLEELEMRLSFMF